MEVFIQKTNLITAIIISKAMSVRNHKDQIDYLVEYFEKKKVYVSLEEVIEFWTAQRFANLLYAKDDLCEVITENVSSQEVKVSLPEDVVEILNWLKLC